MLFILGIAVATIVVIAVLFSGLELFLHSLERFSDSWLPSEPAS